ncbi:hypothetical protein BLNAU_10525 [Blattamonas nauphoetae]|uniref:Uncharacterized protein n=1 Tax=Blattamonas nauphoetae TaxID=2049346 RepID=A0ABQ9XT34_9EUKA|nr:hypothetical protein BLNAU_10525 [Blattamonas nauphoetae]
MTHPRFYVEHTQGAVSTDLAQFNPLFKEANIDDRLEEFFEILSHGTDSEKTNSLAILRTSLKFIVAECCNFVPEDSMWCEVDNSDICVAVELCPRLQSSLRPSTLFDDLLSQSLPSNTSLERCLKLWDVWCSLSEHVKEPTSDFLFMNLPSHFMRTIVPFVQSNGPMRIIPGSMHLCRSFDNLEPLVRKIVKVAGNRQCNYSRTPNQFRAITSFLCTILGAQSLETRITTLSAIYRNLHTIRNTSLGWLDVDTTPFTVTSDGTVLNKTFFDQCSILLTESMQAIESLLAHTNEPNVGTLSAHCSIVSKTFSCLALFGDKCFSATHILETKCVLQQVAAWAGSLIKLPPSPTRNEAVISIIQILVDVRSPSHSALLTSFNMVFPDSNRPLADFFALIEPLINMHSNRAKTIVARFLESFSRCNRNSTKGKSPLFPFFNKFVENGEFLNVSFDEHEFHGLIVSFLDDQLSTKKGVNLSHIDTPSLRHYLRCLIRSHGRVQSKLNRKVVSFIQAIPSCVKQRATTLPFWKDVGGIAAIPRILAQEEDFKTRFTLLADISKILDFGCHGQLTIGERKLIQREMEEEGLADVEELANRSLSKDCIDAIFVPERDPFLNFDSTSELSLEDKSTIYCSLVALVKEGYRFNNALEDKTVHFLKNLAPIWYNRQFTATLVTGLVPSSSDSPSDFVESVLTLLTSPHSTVIEAALSFLNTIVCFSVPAVKLLYVKSDLITNVLTIVQPHTLPIAGNEEIFDNFIAIVSSLTYLIDPSFLKKLRITDAVDKDSHREIIFQKVIIPSYQFVTFLITNRHILNRHLFGSFMDELNTFLQISPFHRPMLEFVLASPIVLVFSSCISSLGNRDFLHTLLRNIDYSLKEWQKEGGEVVHSRKRMMQALFSEGFEDTLDQMLLYGEDGTFRNYVVTDCRSILQLMGENVTEM